MEECMKKTLVTVAAIALTTVGGAAFAQTMQPEHARRARHELDAGPDQ
jgi:hypothetical protein